MQINRLFQIVYILLDKRRVTARELAERFEVSVRTIYRDIDVLSQSGVPVYATQGSGGGIFISDAYVLNKSALTDEEQEQILLALRSVEGTGAVPDALLGRLGSLFRKESTDWIEVDFSRWGNIQRDREMLATIKDAILQRRPLAFAYYSGAGQRTERTVHPLKLVYKDRAWYVQGYCLHREGFRTFKLVRMEAPRTLSGTFDRAALLPLLPPFDSDGDDGEPGPTFYPVLLRFAPEIAWRVMDEFDPSSIRRDEDGMLLVTCFFPRRDWVYRHLLSFGEECELVQPEDFREAMRAYVARIAARYKGD